MIGTYLPMTNMTDHNLFHNSFFRHYDRLNIIIMISYHATERPFPIQRMF